VVSIAGARGVLKGGSGVIIHKPKGEETETLVVMHDFHLNLASQFSTRWGNDTFATPDPSFVLNYMARNHDLGWQEFDRAPGIDPVTGWPYNVVTIPPDDAAVIHRQNIARNYAFHPYAGVLSSMHIMGFFSSRLGMCEFVTINDYAERYPGYVQPLIAECEANIQRWTAEVASNPDTAGWIGEERLRTNYRLLQAYDMLSLYFCLGFDEPVELTNVPVVNGESATVTIEPLGGGTHTLDPYPLAVSPLRIVLDAKRVAQPIEAPVEAMLVSPTVQIEYVVRRADGSRAG
jgi:hypothetical protein